MTIIPLSLEEFQRVIPEIKETRFEIEGNILTANVTTKSKDKYVLYVSGKKSVAYKVN